MVKLTSNSNPKYIKMSLEWCRSIYRVTCEQVFFFGDQTAWTNDDQCLQLHYGRPQIMFAIQPSDAYYCVQLFDSIGFELYAKDRLMTSIEFHLVPASWFLHRQLDGVPML